MLLVVGFGVCLGTFDGDTGAWWAVIALAMAGALVAAVVFINVYSAEDKKQEGKRRVRIRRR